MNSQDFRNLQEAYMEVVMNEGKKPLPIEKMKKKIGNIKSSMKSTIEKSANEVGMNPKRVKFPFSPDDREKYSKYEKRVSDISKNLNKEEVDLYDIILSHLLDEGYAETPEAAEVIMVNMSEDWRESICEEVLDEAEGSYGQTPKASAAYTALHTGKGKSKTKSLALKHAIRAAGDDNSNKPSPKRSKMTQSDRDYHRGQSENGGEDREGIDFDEFDTGASGPGGKPKGKKLERQRKTGVSAD